MKSSTQNAFSPQDIEAYHDKRLNEINKERLAIEINKSRLIEEELQLMAEAQTIVERQGDLHWLLLIG